MAPASVSRLGVRLFEPALLVETVEADGPITTHILTLNVAALQDKRPIDLVGLLRRSAPGLLAPLSDHELASALTLLTARAEAERRRSGASAAHRTVASAVPSGGQAQASPPKPSSSTHGGVVPRGAPLPLPVEEPVSRPQAPVPPSLPPKASTTASPPVASPPTRQTEAPASLAGVLAGIDVDLQRVGPARLAQAKARMDVLFEAKRLKPGDEGFQYDVRQDFQAAAASEWDE